MDALVAQHSRPSQLDDEEQLVEQEDELSLTTPPLSLKFALPPIGNVRDFIRAQNRALALDTVANIHQ